jgi:hypothetical protein
LNARTNLWLMRRQPDLYSAQSQRPPTISTLTGRAWIYQSLHSFPIMTSTPMDELPRIFKINPEFGVLICQLHNAYTESNYGRHLIKRHKIKGETLKRYSQIIINAGLKRSRDKINRPINGRLPIERLKIKVRYGCHQCDFLTTNKNWMKKHNPAHRDLNPTAPKYQKDVHFQSL